MGVKRMLRRFERQTCHNGLSIGKVARTLPHYELVLELELRAQNELYCGRGKFAISE